MFYCRAKAPLAAGLVTALIATICFMKAEEPDTQPHAGDTIAQPNERDPKAVDASPGKITLQQAINLVLSRQSGKVLKAELQREGGVLLYNVTMVTTDQRRRIR